MTFHETQDTGCSCYTPQECDRLGHRVQAEAEVVALRETVGRVKALADEWDVDTDNPLRDSIRARCASLLRAELRGGRMRLFGISDPDCSDGYVAGAWDEVRAAHLAGHITAAAYETVRTLVDALTAEKAEAEVAALREQIDRVKALHRSRVIEFLAFGCGSDDASDECDHDGHCPTEPREVCAACYEWAELTDPYFTDRPVPDFILWPCPTSAALGVTE